MQAGIRGMVLLFWGFFFFFGSAVFGLVLAKLFWGSVISHLSASGSVQGWMTTGQASALPTVGSVLQGMSVDSFLW